MRKVRQWVLITLSILIFIFLFADFLFNALGMISATSELAQLHKKAQPIIKSNTFLYTLLVANLLALFLPFIKKKVIEVKIKYFGKYENKEPAGVLEAKEELLNFIHNIAIPAATTGNEALRLTAHNIKHECTTEDLSVMLFGAILTTGNPNLHLWKTLDSEIVIKANSLDSLQRAIILRLTDYRKMNHTIVRALRHLNNKKEVSIKYNLPEALKSWIPYHEQLEEEFERLQRITRLNILRDRASDELISDPRFKHDVVHEVANS